MPPGNRFVTTETMWKGHFKSQIKTDVLEILQSTSYLMLFFGHVVLMWSSNRRLRYLRWPRISTIPTVPTSTHWGKCSISLYGQAYLWWCTWQANTIVKGMGFSPLTSKKVWKNRLVWSLDHNTWEGSLWRTTAKRNSLYWWIPLALCTGFLGACPLFLQPANHPLLDGPFPSNSYLKYVLRETGQQSELLSVVSLFLTLVGYSSLPDWFWLHGASKVFE